jgi:hypothetical protein
MPITSEPAPSLRPWASATGATPLRTMFNLTCPPKCWVKIGHFYFAGNRTFLLCLDNRTGAGASPHGKAPRELRLS